MSIRPPIVNTGIAAALLAVLWLAGCDAPARQMIQIQCGKPSRPPASFWLHHMYVPAPATADDHWRNVLVLHLLQDNCTLAADSLAAHGLLAAPLGKLLAGARLVQLRNCQMGGTYLRLLPAHGGEAWLVWAGCDSLLLPAPRWYTQAWHTTDSLPTPVPDGVQLRIGRGIVCLVKPPEAVN